MPFQSVFNMVGSHLPICMVAFQHQALATRHLLMSYISLMPASHVSSMSTQAHVSSPNCCFRLHQVLICAAATPRHLFFQQLNKQMRDNSRRRVNSSFFYSPLSCALVFPQCSCVSPVFLCFFSVPVFLCFFQCSCVSSVFLQ